MQPSPRLLNIHYEPSGSGRDSYVIMNNGGFTRDTLPMSARMPQDIRLNAYLPKAKNGATGARPVRYQPNGSGRDHYIAHNDGGNAPAKPITNHIGSGDRFGAHLRSYDVTQWTPVNKGSLTIRKEVKDGIDYFQRGQS